MILLHGPFRCLLLCSRSSVGFLTGAHALAFTSATERGIRFAAPTTIPKSHRRDVVSLLLSSSPEVNGEGDAQRRKKPTSKKKQREGKTGWTHSTPSESSGFWDTSGTGRKEKSSSNKLRTGWLHNTESPSEAAAKKTAGRTSGTSPARRRLEQAMKQQERNHRIVAPPAFHAAGDKMMATTEHVISLPVIRDGGKSSSRVDVFFSIIEKVESRESWDDLAFMSPQQRAQTYVERAALEAADDLVLYLQGGPGFGAPTPVVDLGVSKDCSWAAKALATYSRVVLMDQRGTGRSTPITKQTLEAKFPDLFLLDRKDGVLDELASSFPEEAARVRTAVGEATSYLSNFRANSIVHDAEEIRDALLLPREKEDDTNRPWGCALGQSFGGFCLMTYLSQVEHPPKVCLFTGGIAPILSNIDEVYSSLWERVKERNLRYYDMYPGDIKVVHSIVRKLVASPAPLPSGGSLTARRFLQLGLGLGGSPSSFASMHALLASALIPNDETDTHFSRAFLKRVEMDQSFDDHPIYFWLHESIYADNKWNSPSNWSAHRMYEKMLEATSDFDYKLTSTLDSNDRPTLFFGEMVFPWMTEDYAELSGLGLTEVANALASKADWASLYDENAMKRALVGPSRAAAAVYYSDMYVDFDACVKVFARSGPMEKCNVWINNEYQHSGLRDNGAQIFEKLHGMATGSIQTPS